jgi:hypothetical protein
MTSPTPYQLLPRLTDDEYEALKADIAENGVRVPIDVDEDGVILDGHHRAWITADLGVDCPRRTLNGLTDEGKRSHAVAVNVHRRSLNREQRRDLVARLRNDGMSLRAISAATGISPATAMRDARVSAETPAEITGLDGKPYAATRPQLPVEPASEFAGTEWLEPDDTAIPGQGHVLDHTGLETVTPNATAPVRPDPEPAKAKRRPLPEAFADTTRDLRRAAEQLARLTQDDRFTRNREMTHHQMPDLLGALENTAALVKAMDLSGATASEEARGWWATSLNTISDTLAGVANTLTKEQ